MTWSAGLALVAGCGSLAIRWTRDALKRREEGITIELDTIELDSPDEVFALEATDVLWIRPKSVPPPVPPSVAHPRLPKLAPPDVQAFEMR